MSLNSGVMSSKSTSYEFKRMSNSSNLRVTSLNAWFMSSNSRVTSSNLRDTSSDPQVMSSNSRVTSSNS